MRKIAKLVARLSVPAFAMVRSPMVCAAHQVGEPTKSGPIALVRRGFHVPVGVWSIELAAPMFAKQGASSLTCTFHTEIGF